MMNKEHELILLQVVRNTVTAAVNKETLPSVSSEEAALKYFLLGAFAGGFVVYGIALVFGATATTNLNGIFGAVENGVADMTLLVIGGALILVGFGFKVAVVPFQMWTPDVYEGAPTSVTAFMAVGAKAAGFAALLRIFLAARKLWRLIFLMS